MRGCCRPPWLAAVHPRLRRRPLHRDLCRLSARGKELRPVPRPPGLPHLSGGSARPGRPRAADARSGPTRCRSTRRATPPRSPARSPSGLRAVSKALESSGHAPEEVAMFLMRCLFTMFAEDVELLPKDSLQDLLKRCEPEPDMFPRMMEAALGGDGQGRLRPRHREQVRQFNGEFFKNARSAARPRGDRRAAPRPPP